LREATRLKTTSKCEIEPPRCDIDTLTRRIMPNQLQLQWRCRVRTRRPRPGTILDRRIALYHHRSSGEVWTRDIGRSSMVWEVSLFRSLL